MADKWRYMLALVLAAPLLGGCGTFGLFGGGDEPVHDGVKDDDGLPEKLHPVDVGAKISPSTLEEQELKLAKLWARVDELEEELFRQKEKQRVLEKGFTLGLVPEELKGGKKAHAPAPAHAAPPPPPPAQPVHEAAKPPPPASTPMPGALPPAEQEQYQKMLAVAHDQFRAGRYGRAIVEFDAIGKAFGDKVEGGMHRFWIARSWAALKEYNTARSILTDFLKDHPKSPWSPRAKLELGRVEWRLGLQETALKRFRDVIHDYPHEDAAEMAKMELENLDKTL